MYLLECFTKAHIDNLTACLRLKPKKLFLLGDGNLIHPEIKKYKDFLEKRIPDIEVSPCDIAGKDVHDICQLLLPLLTNKQKWVIDLTDGDTLAVMAVGAVLARLDPEDRQRIQVRKQLDDRIVDCLTNESLSEPPVTLSVKEMIGLHGGTLHPSKSAFSDEVTTADLQQLWEVVSNEPKDWNNAIRYLTEFESRADSDSQIFLHLDYIRGTIRNFDEKKEVVQALLNQFLNSGIIKGRISNKIWEYSYTSSLLRYCTKTPGNVLEVKTLLEARELRKEGVPYFYDCQMGVKIDWDGVIHKQAEKTPDTENEIDIIAVHDATPLFISCKNGTVEEEELYKLHTVATRFGGPYAKKMLIATHLNQKSVASNRALAQRAWDMDIYLITDAGKLSKAEWREEILQAMQ